MSKHYAALGEHRTATPVDIRTSEWLASELKQAGLAVERRPFHLRQFRLKSTRLEVNGKPIECFPAWWPKATGPRPVAGKLADGIVPPAGSIAVFPMPEVRGASLTPGSPVHPI